jgi:hypothetical protein
MRSTRLVKDFAAAIFTLGFSFNQGKMASNFQIQKEDDYERKRRMEYILLALPPRTVQSDPDDARGDEVYGLRRSQTGRNGSHLYGYE